MSGSCIRRSFLWELGKGTSERLYRAGHEAAQAILNSPIGIAYEGGGPVRCDPTAPGEFAILKDLRRDSYTDYVVHAVPFADGSFKALSLATRRPGGFVAWELGLFEAMIPPSPSIWKSRRCAARRARRSTPMSASNPAAACSMARFSAAAARPFRR